MTAVTNQQRQFPCAQCGAMLQFEPGQDSLKCPYCQAENQIAKAPHAAIQELDFYAALSDRAAAEQLHETLTVKCVGCGAESALAPDTTAGKCPFCGAAIVATATSTKRIKPKSLLPFAVNHSQAMQQFRGWIGSLWFAPNELKRCADAGGINGAYLPYWTYDCQAFTQYTGERGEDYTDTETYTTTENGQTVTKTRTVTRTRWWSVSGQVFNAFDDILILATNTLPRNYIDVLEPWDLKNLVPYSDEYLAGFTAESYQVDLRQGFELARQVMNSPIQDTIRRDIGGDHQRINWTQTNYEHITFKHILLPVWISAYRYRDHTYRFLVNARTGEVCGERPYSVAKIAIAVMMVLAVIATILLILYAAGVFK